MHRVILSFCLLSLLILSAFTGRLSAAEVALLDGSQREAESLTYDAKAVTLAGSEEPIPWADIDTLVFSNEASSPKQSRSAWTILLKDGSYLGASKLSAIKNGLKASTDYGELTLPWGLWWPGAPLNGSSPNAAKK